MIYFRVEMGLDSLWSLCSGFGGFNRAACLISIKVFSVLDEFCGFRIFKSFYFEFDHLFCLFNITLP